MNERLELELSVEGGGVYHLVRLEAQGLPRWHCFPCANDVALEEGRFALQVHVLAPCGAPLSIRYEGVGEPVQVGTEPVCLTAGNYTLAWSPRPHDRIYRYLSPGHTHHLFFTGPRAAPIWSSVPANQPSTTAYVQFIDGSGGSGTSHYRLVPCSPANPGLDIALGVTGASDLIAISGGAYWMTTTHEEQEFDRRIQLAKDLRERVLYLRRQLAEQADPSGAKAFGQLICAEIDELVQALLAGGNWREETQRIRLRWLQIKRDPFFTGNDKPSAEETARRATLRGLCDEIVNELAYITIPCSLENWLPAMPVGGRLDFHMMFKDVLPRRAQRQEVLEWLADGETDILNQGGLIDAASGYVYKTRIGNRRWLDLLQIVLFVLLVSAAIYLASKMEGPTRVKLSLWRMHASWQPPIAEVFKIEDAQLFFGWFLVLLGMALHWVIAVSKNQKDELPPARFLSYISAHKVRVMVRFLLAVAALFIVVLPQKIGSLDGSALLNFILAGYALDSVADLLSPFLDSRSKQRTADVRQTMGLPEEAAA